ncbi:cytochrome P450 [Lentinus tigrinus ALCF2SS1-7]|uniref:cytochrome P450 n=1 Tax=Lentinus tigrinus ALCF2SS1-7 TaxID=1328758 RepID=UPI00116630E8|nr:cytochrome P450 [Lentinus tigrinus ALCF2SS1-7]
MEVSTLLYAFLILVVARLFIKWYSDPLRRIPVVGGTSFPLLSYLAALKFIRRPNDVLLEGHAKYHGSAFRVGMLDRWLVVVSGLDGVEDLRRRPENELTLSVASNQLLQRERILGSEILQTHWHAEVLKTTFTQSIPTILPDLIDELPSAVLRNLPTATDGWQSVEVKPAVLGILAQLNSRVFVGLPLCRNQDYLKLAIDFTVNTMKDAQTMKLTPQLFRPLVARFLTETRTALFKGRTYIEPLVRARREKINQFGNDWPDKPHDLLQLYMEYAADKNATDEMVAQRAFHTNFAAIFTATDNMTNTLCHLASSPEAIGPLRAEAEELIASYGWTKDAIDRMWKAESFLRESARLHTLAPFVITRVAMRDLTLVDGTFVPKGTLVAAAVAPAHRDSNNYPQADVFDPFRFSRQREEKGASATQMFTHTSGKWLAFGHGKHACPGRYYAADELKTLLSYIVVNYDIKADRPNGGFETGKIMVRKRQSSSKETASSNI